MRANYNTRVQIALAYHRVFRWIVNYGTNKFIGNFTHKFMRNKTLSLLNILDIDNLQVNPLWQLSLRVSKVLHYLTLVNFTKISIINDFKIIDNIKKLDVEHINNLRLCNCCVFSFCTFLDYRDVEHSAFRYFYHWNFYY